MRGATSIYGDRNVCWFKISIHAPHAGRDLVFRILRVMLTQFQSTRPMRGATIHITYAGHYDDISIHAPHAGRDFLISFSQTSM